MSRKVKEQQETVIYIGPTMPGIVKKYTVYNNGVPEVLKVKIEELPILKNLLVPVSKLNHAKQELNQESSALRVVYNKVLEQSKGGRG